MSSASTSARRSPTAARRRCRPTSASSTPTWGRKMALLELHDVRASYGAIRALHGVSLKVEEGSIVALLGANGAGKTTTLRAITGMVKATGEISFAGRHIAGKAPEEVARLGIAHVPSGRGTMPHLAARDNLQLGAYLPPDPPKPTAHSHTPTSDSPSTP